VLVECACGVQYASPDTLCSCKVAKSAEDPSLALSTIRSWSALCAARDDFLVERQRILCVCGAHDAVLSVLRELRATRVN
jgi:hypothetical protein